MRMKRFAALALAALTALSLCGCGASGDKDKDKEMDGAMTIQPAQLSEEESALVELLEVELGAYRIFDLQVEGAKSIRIAAYELVDNDWSLVHTGLGAFSPEGMGRISLAFGKMNEGVSVRFQGADGGGGTKFVMPGGDEGAALTFATSALSAPAAVELEAEIPLVLQVATSKSEFSTWSVDYFGMPRELAKQGYEHVYAITVTFSAGPVADASQDAPSAEPSPKPE